MEQVIREQFQWLFFIVIFVYFVSSYLIHILFGKWLLYINDNPIHRMNIKNLFLFAPISWPAVVKVFLLVLLDNIHIRSKLDKLKSYLFGEDE